MIAIMRSARRLAVAGVLVLGVSGPVVAGWDEGIAAYDRGDYETAYKEFLPLAQAGDATAQFYLGVMYNNGLGVPQDHAQAVRRDRTAAEQTEVDNRAMPSDDRDDGVQPLSRARGVDDKVKTLTVRKLIDRLHQVDLVRVNRVGSAHLALLLQPSLDKVDSDHLLGPLGCGKHRERKPYAALAEHADRLSRRVAPVRR